MPEKPIILPDWQVRAALDPERGVTRITVPMKPQPPDTTDEILRWCPHPPETVLWVHETWHATGQTQQEPTAPGWCMIQIHYRADSEHLWCSAPSEALEQYTNTGPRRYCNGDCRWRSPVTMPRWACRLRFRVTGVRVQRVGEITDYEIEHCEGVPLSHYYCDEDKGAWGHVCGAQARFAELWQARYGKKYPWSGNPWVWGHEVDRLHSTPQAGKEKE